MFCLTCEQRFCEAGKQRGRAGIYLDASGFSERTLREPAAKYSDGGDPRLPRCFGIIGRITDRDGVGAFDLEVLENGLEDVRRRFRFFYVVGSQVGDACDVGILFDITLLGRGSNGDFGNRPTDEARPL